MSLTSHGSKKPKGATCASRRLVKSPVDLLLLLVALIALVSVFASVAACGTESEVSQARAAPVGQIVTFGAWEQDGDAANGTEPLKWVVLDKKNGHVLLLAEKALATRPYNDAAGDATWQDCTLRTWLNGEFYTGAFSEADRAAVRQTAVPNPDNAERGTAGGAEVQDHIFLLSADELETYCSDEVRACSSTPVAADQGAWVSPDNGCVDWWLRTPGSDQAKAADVGSDGLLYPNGYPVESADVAVRPALWL